MRRAFQAALPAEVPYSSETSAKGSVQLTGNIDRKRISESLERKKKPAVRPSEKLKRGSDFVIEDVEDTYSGAPGGLRRLPEALEIVKPAEIEREDTTDVIRQRITEEPTVQPGPIERRRITEDQPRKSKRVRGNVVATLAGSLASRSRGLRQTQKVWLSLVTGISIVLIVLLLMPRVLGYSFFPSGFPVLGTPPVATIYVTLQTRNLQDSFLLTASPQVKQPDVVAHTIPGRVLQQSASTSGSAVATGNQSSAGTRASGILTIINGSNKTVTVPVHQSILASSGIRLETLELVSVSPHDRNDVRAQAITPGIAGNIAAHAADGSCCSTGVQVRNSAPFTGGTDPQGARIVLQSDIDKLKASLISKLEQSLQQQLKQQLQKDELMGGTPELKTEASPDHQAGDVADQVSMTVTINASVGAYKRTDATSLAGQLLRAQAIQSLESSYQLQGELAIGQPNAQSGKDGVVYVNINAKGTWGYILNEQTRASWLQSIRGSTSDAALAYLSARPGIASVQITLPFGADHLPASTNDIRIVVV
jgi:hypothetical protein